MSANTYPLQLPDFDEPCSLDRLLEIALRLVREADDADDAYSGALVDDEYELAEDARESRDALRAAARAVLTAYQLQHDAQLEQVTA